MLFAVQDRYAGDVGDFMKFGLLRAIIGVWPIRLGVNWYLTGDESHNGDGRHIGYLEPGSTFHDSLRRCDPELMKRLAQVVTTRRCVASLEERGVLPMDSITFAEPLDDPMGQSDRDAWHQRALERLAEAEIVFVDPDNGIRSSRRGTRPSKFAFLSELGDYSARGQSLVIYHHADRSAGGVAAQVPRRLEELAIALAVEPMGAVIARRGSTRFFFVVPALEHVEPLARGIEAHRQVWENHSEFIPFARSDLRLSSRHLA